MSQGAGIHRTLHRVSVASIRSDYLNNHIEVAAFKLCIELEVRPFPSQGTLVGLLTVRVHPCSIFLFVSVATAIVPEELLEQAVILEFAAVVKLGILEDI